MQGRWLGLGGAVALFLAASAACSDGADEPARGSCKEGAHPVGSACVPDIFDDADIPSGKGVPIDTDETGESYLRGMALLVLRDPAGGREAAKAAAAINGGVVTGGIPFAGIYQVRYESAVTATDLGTAILTLGFDARVESVTRDIVSTNVLDAPDPSDTEKVSPDAQWTDPFGPYPGLVGAKGKWAYESTGVYEAWKAIDSANPTTTPVSVAVLDDLVTQAPVFSALPLYGGYDLRLFGAFSEREPAIHGNQVASIIGAPNDGTGINGIAAGLPKCVKHDVAPIAVVADYLLPGETIPDAGPDAGGGATPVGTKHAGQSALLMGMVFAVRSGARVVNMSLGANYGSDPGSQKHFAVFGKIQRAIFRASPDVLWLAAGRNDGGDDRQTLPAAAGFGDTPNVLTVDPLKVSDGASRGRWKWRDAQKVLQEPFGEPGSAPLAAPGEDVLAQLPNGDLTMFLGASSATPVVSGVAALMFAVNPEMTGEDARDILLASARPSGDPSIQGKRLDAKKALETTLTFVQAAFPERMGKGTCAGGPAPDAGEPPPPADAGPPSDPVCRLFSTCRFCGMTKERYTEDGKPPRDIVGTGFVDQAWSSDTFLDVISFVTYENGASSAGAEKRKVTGLVRHTSFDISITDSGSCSVQTGLTLGDKHPGTCTAHLAGTYGDETITLSYELSLNGVTRLTGKLEAKLSKTEQDCKL